MYHLVFIYQGAPGKITTGGEMFVSSCPIRLACRRPRSCSRKVARELGWADKDQPGPHNGLILWPSRWCVGVEACCLYKGSKLR